MHTSMRYKSWQRSVEIVLGGECAHLGWCASEVEALWAARQLNQGFTVAMTEGQAIRLVDPTLQRMDIPYTEHRMTSKASALLHATLINNLRGFQEPPLPPEQPEEPTIAGGAS